MIKIYNYERIGGQDEEQSTLKLYKWSWMNLFE